MQTVQANWEDEENNRHVEFSVTVTRQENDVEIQSITPNKVTFFCPETKSPLRSVNVWTDKGRALLKGQLHNSGHYSKFEEQVEATLAV